MKTGNISSGASGVELAGVELACVELGGDALGGDELGGDELAAVSWRRRVGGGELS